MLIPPKDMMYRLKDECSSTGNILDQVKYRSEWIKYQEAQKRREEEELEKERGTPPDSFDKFYSFVKFYSLIFQISASFVTLFSCFSGICSD